MSGRIHSLIGGILHRPLGILTGVVITLTISLLPVDARADFINLTGAETAPNIVEITVLDDRVKLVLEIYIGDLENFEELIPDDWVKDSAAERPGSPVSP